ncbi:MAG TPA: glutamate racemase [Actinomycetota bacterium]|nr:glutamate racemase [Actinomycetota bacterium]
MVGAERPIGVFDSGVGGLTVARAIIDLLPHEDMIYFADAARFPYGPRPPEEVRAYALEIADMLVDEGVKLIVVACNSAESAAFYRRQRHYDIPVVTVIEPGVKASVTVTRNRRIGLAATEATVASGAYETTMREVAPDVTLVSQACPKFVDFVERGETASEALLAVATDYLAPLQDAGVDTVILGCTHYPLLSGVIQYVMGDWVVLVSSAEATATDVYATLLGADLLNRSDVPGKHRFLTSGEETLFGELGRRFLGAEFQDVERREWSA